MRTATDTSDDEEDEEAEKAAVAPVAPEADGEEATNGYEAQSSKKKRSGDSMELVEYSPDELRAVDKEMLNAEISQLEGE